MKPLAFDYRFVIAKHDLFLSLNTEKNYVFELINLMCKRDYRFFF